MGVQQSNGKYTWSCPNCGASGGTYHTQNAAQSAYDDHVSECND
jgi:Zn-finger protein